MDLTHVKFKSEDGIGILEFNRPERLNAYSLQTAGEILALCNQLDHDRSVRVVIVHGAGRAFCAGLDMKEGVDGWQEDVGVVQGRYLLQQRLASITVRLRELPQPVIAAVHGPAVGGGLALACAADIRIADTTARFNAAFVRLGLSGGDDGVTWFLPRIVGPSVAADILYTGRFIGAEEALEIGLVSRLVDEGTHLAAAVALGREILSNPPLGVRMTKELLNYSLGSPSLRDVIQMENRTQVLCLTTEDFAEGTKAYEEKRAPRFTDH